MLLDQDKTYKPYDKSNIGADIARMHEQVEIAWRETRDIKMPKAYRGVTNVVVVGMGGSHLGPHLAVSAFRDRLRVPVVRVRGYSLPSFVSSKTLVVLSSFSGTTEEVLYAGREAKKRKAKIAVLTAGGKLGAFARRNKFPEYRFNPKELAAQPRLGTGFLMMGFAGLLERAGLLKLSGKDAKAMSDAMQEVTSVTSREVPAKCNPAKFVARALKGRSLLIASSEHLVGNAHVMANQINENAKQLADFVEIPELNHHLMEGLTYPKGLTKKTTVLVLHSELYHERVQKRYDFTAQVFEKQGAKVIEYFAGGRSAIQEAGEVLQFGAFLSYYLGMLNKENPEKIPYVDWFKKKMVK